MKRIWSLQTLQLKKITAANVEAVCNAAVAVTNCYKVIECRDKKLITFEQVEALLGNGNPAFMCTVACNAFDSSNDIIRASTYSKLEELALTSADHDYEAIGWLSWLGCEFHYSKARLTSTKKLVAAGKKVHAIRMLLRDIPNSVLLGEANDEFDAEYVSYIKEIYPTFVEAWLTTEEDYSKTDPWLSGLDIVHYAIVRAEIMQDFGSLDVFSPKVVKFITAQKDSNAWWLTTSRKNPSSRSVEMLQSQASQALSDFV